MFQHQVDTMLKKQISSSVGGLIQRAHPAYKHLHTNPSSLSIFHRFQSTTQSTPITTKMPSSAAFFDALAVRRSYYSLKATSPIPDSKIQEIFNNVLLKTPSSFNLQSTRIVLLLKEEHIKFWEIVKDILRNKIGEERFNAGTGQKLDGFRAAYGTALFYEDQPSIDGMKVAVPSYKNYFDQWSEHGSGMHQLAAWVALEIEGFGANLQHYNPICDEKTAEAFGIPKEWKLKAQLVFGTPVGDSPAPKDKKPSSETLFVHGA